MLPVSKGPSELDPMHIDRISTSSDIQEFSLAITVNSYNA